MVDLCQSSSHFLPIKPASNPIGLTIGCVALSCAFRENTFLLAPKLAVGVENSNSREVTGNASMFNLINYSVAPSESTFSTCLTCLLYLSPERLTFVSGTFGQMRLGKLSEGFRSELFS